MSETTPGRANYEAVAARIGGEFDSWDKVRGETRKAWEDGAQAAIAAAQMVMDERDDARTERDNLRARFEALATKWEAEADDADPGAVGAAMFASRKAAVRQKRICLRQLRQAMGERAGIEAGQ